MKRKDLKVGFARLINSVLVYVVSTDPWKDYGWKVLSESRIQKAEHGSGVAVAYPAGENWYPYVIQLNQIECMTTIEEFLRENEESRERKAYEIQEKKDKHHQRVKNAAELLAWAIKHYECSEATLLGESGISYDLEGLTTGYCGSDFVARGVLIPARNVSALKMYCNDQ